MDLKRELFDAPKNGDKGGWKATSMSLAIHGLLVAGVIYAGTHEPTHKVDAEKPIAAFVTQGAAPPPPPPPPPPPEAGGGAPKATPRVQTIPIETPKPVRLTPPVETPKELPKVNVPTSLRSLPAIETPAEPASGGGAANAAGDAAAGVPGGVAGGVAGGIVGGELGGIVGGVIGGVKGGELGGKLGGQLGGKGTGTEGDGTGGPEAPVAPPPPPPPPEPTGPLRVGGDVKAPVATSRQKPAYTEAARRAKVAGIVVLEAVIDRNGNVKDVRVVKDLPMGLSEQAVNAVRQWKFRPGSLNGRPVDTVFNLTVSFELD